MVVFGARARTSTRQIMELEPGATRTRKRRPKGTCPNPLFVRWLEEWRDEARKEGKNTQYAYSKALTSLKKYPLPLSSGQEAKIVEHIGERIAKLLDRRLAKHREEVNSSPPCSPGVRASQSTKTRSHSSQSDEDSPRASKKRKCAVSEYVPVYRSGPYAILIALYREEKDPNGRRVMRKADVVRVAQPDCDTSFTVPDVGSYYTAWSSMSSLLSKGLVTKISHPPKFSLTDYGASLAERLLKGTAVTSGSSAGSPPLRSSSTASPPSPVISGQRPPPSPVISVPRGKTVSVSHTGGRTEKTCATTSPRPTSQKTTPSPSPTPATQEVPTRQPGVGAKVMLHDEVTLLDSDEDSDVEIILPLAKRLALKPGERSAGGGGDATTGQREMGRKVPQRPGACVGVDAALGESASSRSWELHSKAVKRRKLDSNDSDTQRLGVAALSTKEATSETDAASVRRQGSSARDHDTSGRTLTPSQMAGVAALRRLNIGKHCTTEACSGSPTLRKQDGANFQFHKPSLPVSPQAPCSGTPVCDGRGGVSSPATSPPVFDLTDDDEAEACCIVVDSVARGSWSHKSASEPLKKDTGRPFRRVDRQSKSIACTASSSSSSSSSSLSVASSSQRPAGVLRAPGAGRPSACPVAGGPSACPVDLSRPQFTLQAGSYEVILCIDNSESAASRRSNSQFRGLLLQELGKNGVKFDVRKLNVGDFLWLAREQTAPRQGQLALPSCPGREVVLEYIVERKRLDDLAGSIIDGRFSEQKFRLHHCGVRHPIYLVEDYADLAHVKLPEATLEQAISNTQIISEFFVKRTKDVRESVAYLTIMTRYLQNHYSGRAVKVFPVETIAELHKAGGPPADSTVYSAAFDSFNEASIKNKVLSVREMFGRHLLQLPGVSADKAAAVLERYPTVSCLRAAYRACGERGRATMLADIRCGPTKRKLGPVVSSLLCALYWKGNNS